MFSGVTGSVDGDVTGNHGIADMWVIKTDTLGNILWQKCYGGSDADAAYSIRADSSGGYIVAGYSDSNDGDVSGLHGNPGFGYADFWIVKIDTVGNIEWQKCLGGTDVDRAYDIQSTNDSGYIVGGYTKSYNTGDVTGHNGALSHDYWIAKVDMNGSLQWQKCLGGLSDDECYSVIQALDNNYYAVGYTFSNSGYVSGSHGLTDAWLIKLDSAGNFLWQRCLGGSQGEVGNSIIQLPSGNLVIAGGSSSFDGNVSGNHGVSDAWMVMTDSSGNIIRQKCLGGFSIEYGLSVRQTVEGGFIVATQAGSDDGDVTGHNGGFDLWIVKLDSLFNIEWQKCMGGSGDDQHTTIEQTSDGGFIVLGTTFSNDGDVSGNHGVQDYWAVKLSADPLGIFKPSNPISDFTASFSSDFDALNIQFYANGDEHTEIQLTDITGRILMQQQLQVLSGINSNRINVGMLSRGIYLVTVITNEEKVTKKVLMQRTN